MIFYLMYLKLSSVKAHNNYTGHNYGLRSFTVKLGGKESNLNCKLKKCLVKNLSLVVFLPHRQIFVGNIQFFYCFFLLLTVPHLHNENLYFYNLA